MLARLKHIRKANKKLADGSTTTYYYHRWTNKRIHGQPGTQEFVDNYMLASKSDNNIEKGTVIALISEYKSSQVFAKLRDKTRKDYDKHLIKIGEKWGATPLKVFEDPRIRKDLIKWRDGIGKTAPRQADYMWDVFRRVIQFAVHQGDLAHNHMRRPGRLHKSDRSDKIWLPADVSALINAANLTLQTAMILALHTGQRKGDLIRLKWTDYDGESITFQQSKTRRKIYIPCTSTLKRVLDTIERPGTTILTNTRGKAWTEDGFTCSWGKAAKKAGVKGLTFHDLRGTAVTLLAEQGCTSIEIATITGHTLKYVETILDVYASRTKAIARAAILRLEGSWING